MALVSAENMTAQATGFGTLPAFRQLGLLVGLALTIALGITIAMWSQTPNYSVLVSDLSARDLAQATQSLDSSNIKYTVTNNGHTLMVPAEKLQQAKMKMASQGISAGDNTGYALLDKEQGFGRSSFMQKARYNRAIEGELAKSIGDLDMIEGARVHLAMPKQSAFVRKNSKPAASVVLNVRPGWVLNDSQIAGIVNMVASSVPGLEAENVTVIDQNGRLLSQKGSSDMMLSSTQFNYTRRFENSYVKRIVDILSPIVGVNGVRAQVVADIDFTSQEKTSESYSPGQKALRSEQIFKEDNTASPAMGIPGALSNQPPAAGTTNADVAAKEQKTGTGFRTSRAVRNFELGKTISHTRTSPTALKKLSVAVIVDYVNGVDKKGKRKRVPLDAATINHIKALVKETVGFNSRRGDTINVVNTPFLLPAKVKPLPQPPMWQQPWVMNLVKQIVGGLGVLFIVLVVLRPMLKNLSTQAAKKNNAVSGDVMPQAQLASPDGERSQTLTNEQSASGDTRSNEQQLIEIASNMAKEDPKRVAQVMSTWVAEDE